MKLRLGILSQWYEPEPGGARIPGALARGLTSLGHDVHVLTGHPNYPDGRLYPGYEKQSWTTTASEGLSVTRVPLYPNHGSSAGRAINFGSFAVSAVGGGLRRMRGLDALWVYNSPVTVALPMWALRHGAGVPIFLHNMDMWPDSVTAAGFSGNSRASQLAERGLNVWCNRMYRSASVIGYISPSAGEELAARGVDRSKLRYLPLWADESLSFPDQSAGAAKRKELGISDDEILVMYAGTMGAAQGLERLVQAVMQRPGDTRIRCVLIGSGTREVHLRELAASSSGRVQVLAGVPAASVGPFINAADIHYIGLAHNRMSTFTMPSKFQSVLAAGKALLVSAEGDVLVAARQSGAALIAPLSGGVEALSDQISVAEKLGRRGLFDMGSQGERHYRSELSESIGIRRVAVQLESLARHRRRRPVEA